MNRYFDAHNHIHAPNIQSDGERIIDDIRAKGVSGMVSNGTCQGDWSKLLEIATRHTCIIPAFGYHPWFIDQATKDWQMELESFLDILPATIGEIGLDRSKKGIDFENQQLFFRSQLEIAKQRSLAVTIHCTEAWGALVETLSNTRHKSGFLLHSYSGSVELIPSLLKLGAFFSFPGSYLHEKKQKRCATFSQIPIERILIETDSPHQRLPELLDSYQLKDQASNTIINHPGNLISIYRGFAEIFNVEIERLSEQIEKNYHSLFGTWARS